MIRIVINGGPEVGKDSFVKSFRKFTVFYVANLSTVDRVKQAFSTLGWNGEKTPENREFLSDLKDLWTKHCDGPFRDIVERMSMIPDNSIVVIHSREPEEIQRFKKELGCYTLLIVRNTGIEPSNHADREVQEMEYDYVVENNGTLEDLERAAGQFMVQLTRDIDEVNKKREKQGIGRPI